MTEHFGSKWSDLRGIYAAMFKQRLGWHKLDPYTEEELNQLSFKMADWLIDLNKSKVLDRRSA